jgi:formylmethanofuran dehydrogenase subunit E
VTVIPFPAPRDEDGRVLRCRSCGEPVLVFELPTVWLAEDAYVCGRCLEPKVTGA